MGCGASMQAVTDQRLQNDTTTNRTQVQPSDPHNRPPLHQRSSSNNLSTRSWRNLETVSTNTPLPHAPPTTTPTTLRSCGALTKMIVDTSFKDWSPAKLDYTPVSESEKLQFLFYCPICMLHQERGAACNKCRHHICFDCAESMLLRSINHDEMKCPHCRENTTLDVVKCSKQIVRTYVDSPRTLENQKIKSTKEYALTIANQTVTNVIETAAALTFKRTVSHVSAQVGTVTLNEMIG